MAAICSNGVKRALIVGLLVACVVVGLSAGAGANPIVLFDTSVGSFEVELFPDAAPQSVANFLQYVNSGAYNNTFIHRNLHAETGFGIVQGGGYSASSAPFFNDTTSIPHIATLPAIPLEYNLPNAIGTIAMARTNDPNSTTSEFFFNSTDNSSSLGPSNGGGYAVFGQIVGSPTVLNAINSNPSLNDLTGDAYDGNILGDIPLLNFDLATAEQIDASNLVVIRSVTVVPEPSTIALVSLGGVGLIVMARRRADRR